MLGSQQEYNIFNTKWRFLGNEVFQSFYWKYDLMIDQIVDIFLRFDNLLIELALGLMSANRGDNVANRSSIINFTSYC